MKFVKNDADSSSRVEGFTSLAEKLISSSGWLKNVFLSSSLVEERKCVAEIADLMRYVKKDQLVFDQCIEQLAKLHGKVKLWQ